VIAYTHHRLARYVAAILLWYWTTNSRFAMLLREQAGAAGDVALRYAASTTPSVTNLQSLAASSTWVAGWESGEIDNSSNRYTDYIINLKLVRAATNQQSGEHRMYLVAMLDDTTWPDPFDGSETTESISDTEQRDAICRLAAIAQTDGVAGETDYLMCPSVAAVFNGVVPRKFVVFVTTNGATSTNAALASSGNALYVTGVYANVAQS
jgi:hypothetical protein